MSTATASAERPVTIIRPDGGLQIARLRELWEYRGLLLVFAMRDIKLRYRQTALGVIWVILQPLVAASIFAIVFGRIARLPSDGVPYFLFAYAGFLAWNAFQSTLNRSATSLLQNSQLVSKIYFPRAILPLSTVLLALLDFGVGAILLLVLWPLYGAWPGPGILLLPVWLALILLLAAGTGLYLSALAVRYRDIQHALPVVIPLLLYASPVAYGLRSVPEPLRLAFQLNPVSGLLEAFRWSLLGTGSVSWSLVAYSSGMAVLLLVLGVRAFNRFERSFADVI